MCKFTPCLNIQNGRRGDFTSSDWWLVLRFFGASVPNRAMLFSSRGKMICRTSRQGCIGGVGTHPNH